MENAFVTTPMDSNIYDNLAMLDHSFHYQDIPYASVERYQKEIQSHRLYKDSMEALLNSEDAVPESLSTHGTAEKERDSSFWASLLAWWPYVVAWMLYLRCLWF